MGVKLNVKVGQAVEKGKVWVELKHECEEVPKDLWRKLEEAITISSQPSAAQQSRILEVIE